MLASWTGALLVLQIGLVCASVDWCSLRCSNGDLHTMCGYDEVGPSHRRCTNMRNTMTPSKRADLLHWHNEYRNLMAEGKLSVAGKDLLGVANMRQMTYYDDLETVAQKWAEQCILAHDVCRTTPRFEDYEGFNSGQNFGTQMSDLRMPSSGMTRYNFLEWAKERKNVPAVELASFGDKKESQGETWYHWTQLVWANSYTLGCAEVVYEIGDQFERTTFCNYGPGGNLVGQKVFKVGPACSSCPHGTSCRANSDYPSLCALPEDPTTRESFIARSRSVSHAKPEVLYSSEEDDDEESAPVQYRGKQRGNAWAGARLVKEKVRKHEEPGVHEPEPEEHDEPGEHEPESPKHQEPGKHELKKPRKHKEPGEHEPMLKKHDEPGVHEPAPERHMEPGEHEEMHRTHEEPGQHEEFQPGGGPVKHKEPGRHESIPRKHEEPGVHEPLPERHKEPGNHERASPKKHIEPGKHEPKNPKKHSEPGEHEPELKKHKEPGEHEPEFEEHNEPGDHEEAHSRIYYGARADPADPAPAAPAPAAPTPAAPTPAAPTPAAPTPAAPAAADPTTAAPAAADPTTAAPAAADPTTAAPDAPDPVSEPGAVPIEPPVEPVDPTPNKWPQIYVQELLYNNVITQKCDEIHTQCALLVGRSLKREPVRDGNGTKSGGENGTIGGKPKSTADSGCMRQWTMTDNGLGAFSAVAICLMCGWFGGIIYLIERLV